MTQNFIRITKRDGTFQPLDIGKIQEFTSSSVKGLDKISQSELEVDARIKFYDKMTTSEIQEALIKTAVDKIDVDRPDWSFVAARLFLYDLYHKVNSKNSYPLLKTYFKVCEDEGRILKSLKNGYDLDELNDYIDESRDLQFTYLGVKTLYDRYLIKNRGGEPIELPQHMFMAIAMFLAQNESKKMEMAKKFYDLMSKFEVMPGTPTISNARTPRHQLSSCYIGSTPDNIEGIFDSYKEMALLSKYGGGIGWDYSKLRGMGSFIDNHKNAASGSIPFLRITNDVALAVDQLGTRKGAIAVYLEPWHTDVELFLELKKNTGTESLRTHDLFPALWINDLFMKRVRNNENWSLFDPYRTPTLTELHGEEFEKEYEAYEANPLIKRVNISAKELWKKILISYHDTGSPFLTFKDTANRANPNAHKGIIRSSNLCTEIFQNTSPDYYRIKVIFEDGSEKFYEEEEMIHNDVGEKKPAKKISSLDKINNQQVFCVEKLSTDGDTAVCNLASINVSKVHTKEDIERVVPVAIRMLDNVIDLNFYPKAKVKRTNLKSRSIGLGVMGEAEMLANKHIHWGSDKHFNTIDELMEMISYNAINSSCDLGKEKGVYKDFAGSKWSQGIFPKDMVNEKVKELISRVETYDWDKLKEKVKENGMRNGYLMAIAPTSSISILVGTTQTIEPVYKHKWFEENLSGFIPTVAPNINTDNYQYYDQAYKIDQTDLVKAGAIRSKWLDQGQSLNIFINEEKATGRNLNNIYMLAWELGLKSTYYLRSESAKNSSDVVNRDDECTVCQ